MVAERLPVDPLAPWPTLSQRDTGELPAPESHEGIPSHLAGPLGGWVANALTYMAESRIGEINARLRIWASSPAMATPSLTLRAAIGGREVGSQSPVDQLSALDALIHMEGGWSDGDFDGDDLWHDRLSRLDSLLVSAGSAWQVDYDLRGLSRRVDPTAVEAWRRARGQAELTGRQAASRHLLEAWRHTYGPQPSPDTAYGAAVKAVEDVAVPEVSPESPRASLGTVCRDLRSQFGQWELVLATSKDQPASIEPLIALARHLWDGQRSRHDGGPTSRSLRQDEAEAAVHAAVLLVQWFSTGAVRRKAP